MGVNIW